MGVEIFPACAGETILYDNYGDTVIGVATNDVGINKQGNPKPYFSKGIKIFADNTLFAEGCRGHLTQELIKKFELDNKSNYMSYAIGLKELWRLDKSQHKPGYVMHTMGWPSVLIHAF